MKFSSCRLIRIMTGLPAFLDSSAGIPLWIEPEALLPKPPPQYSAMTTTSSGAALIPRAAGPWVLAVLCVDTCK